MSPAAAAKPMYIREFRVLGAHLLPHIEVEETVYPFLGPGRTPNDVQQAASALEKAYKDKGFQTVTVDIPPQSGRGGVVVLQVEEVKVGRLRVKGSRYFSIDAIKARAKSMQEGTVPNFNAMTADVLALNQLADRKVTPTLRPGVEPGTIDIDLTVKDTNPLHASIELNNRNSPNTTPLRLSTSASYNNLWQLGNSAGGSYQVALEREKDSEIYSLYYIARMPGVEWLSLMLSYTKQAANITAQGFVPVNSISPGETWSATTMVTLPPGKDFFQTLNFGVDYKHYDQSVRVGSIAAASASLSPISYYPFFVNYTGTWAPKGSVTEVDASVTWGNRGLGSRSEYFDISRYHADGNFIVFKGDLSRLQDLPAGFQGYAKAQGQIANEPLINAEQMPGGGYATVRGYLESEVLGDNGIFGTFELRAPTVLGWLGKDQDLRPFVFADIGMLTLRNALPEQQSFYDLASVGFGSRIHIYDHFNGEFDAALPLIGQAYTHVHEGHVTFRIWADF